MFRNHPAVGKDSKSFDVTDVCIERQLLNPACMYIYIVACIVMYLQVGYVIHSQLSTVLALQMLFCVGTAYTKIRIHVIYTLCGNILHVCILVYTSCSAAWALQLFCWKYSDLCTLGMYVTYKTHSYRPAPSNIYLHTCVYIDLYCYQPLPNYMMYSCTAYKCTMPRLICVYTYYHYLYVFHFEPLPVATCIFKNMHTGAYILP